MQRSGERGTKSRVVRGSERSQKCESEEERESGRAREEEAGEFAFVEWGKNDDNVCTDKSKEGYF